MSDPPADLTHLRLRVHGRVQGVGFRYFTARSARDHGLKGFVRNEPDGSVLCEVQGPAELVDQFVDAVRRGPKFARVDDLAIEPLHSTTPHPTGFEIH